jgi:arylsulfatase
MGYRTPNIDRIAREGANLVPAQMIVGEFLKTFKDFPPRQRPASFSIDQALEKARKSQEAMSRASAGSN